MTLIPTTNGKTSQRMARKLKILEGKAKIQKMEMETRKKRVGWFLMDISLTVREMEGN